MARVLSLLRIGAAALAIAVLGLWAGARWMERNRLFFPDRRLDVNPRSMGMASEDVALVTADGLRLHGWFIPAAPFKASPKDKKPVQGPLAPKGLVVLFCHGNAGNISNRVHKASLLHRLGLSVFLFDYRGFGESEGRPTEKGTYLDADAAYRYLTETRAIPPERIVIHGESIGNGVAIEAATRHPSRALIVESAFTSIVAMGKLAVSWLPLEWFVSCRYDNLAKLPKVARPVLVMHSRDDEVIPFEMGRALFQAAAEPKQFLELKGTHNDGYVESGPSYSASIRDFLARY